MISHTIPALLAAFTLIGCSSPKPANDAETSRKKTAKVVRWLSSHSAGDSEKEKAVLDFCELLSEKNYDRLLIICTKQGIEAVKKCNLFSQDYYFSFGPSHPSVDSMEYDISNEYDVHSPSFKGTISTVVLVRIDNRWKVNNVVTTKEIPK